MCTSLVNAPPGSIPRKPSLLMNLRFVRREFRRTKVKVLYGSQALEMSPILFANSFPKSGTHLLTQVMKGFTRLGPAVDSGLTAIVTFQGDTGRQRSAEEIRVDLERLQPGDIAYGHLHATPEAVGILCQDGIAAFLILRDPRDVVVSHVHYILEMAPQHIHHSYYRELKDFDACLDASIAGFKQMNPDGEGSDKISLPDIWKRFEPYLGWLDHPEVLCLRFEDFVRDRQAAVEQVFDQAVKRGFQSKHARNEAVTILLNSIDPAHSPTFRSGKSGEWRTAFTEKHKATFKEITGDMLIRLGYEDNNDW